MRKVFGQMLSNDAIFSIEFIVVFYDLYTHTHTVNSVESLWMHKCNGRYERVVWVKTYRK